MSLEGQVALITGATSGIGLATAEALAAKGVKLVIAGRRQGILSGHARRLQDCAALAGDIADPAMAERLIALALERFGRLDIVVNNAGQIHNAAIEEIDVELVCRMVRINVESAFRLGYLALKHFREMRRGHLVNTSSVLGTKTRINSGAYAGTKYAIEAWSEALRLELAGSAIKVTCVEPGLVITDLHRDYEVRPEVMQDIARPLAPEHVAGMILYALEQPDNVATPRLMILPQDQQI